MIIVPLPSSSSFPPSHPRAVLVADDRAVASLITLLLDRSGVSQHELARRLGIRVQSLAQYKRGKRSNPSVKWLARLVEACGGKLYVEFPTQGTNQGG